MGSFVHLYDLKIGNKVNITDLCENVLFYKWAEHKLQGKELQILVRIKNAYTVLFIVEKFTPLC